MSDDENPTAVKRTRGRPRKDSYPVEQTVVSAEPKQPAPAIAAPQNKQEQRFWVKLRNGYFPFPNTPFIDDDGELKVFGDLKDVGERNRRKLKRGTKVNLSIGEAMKMVNEQKAELIPDFGAE